MQPALAPEELTPDQEPTGPGPHTPPHNSSPAAAPHLLERTYLFIKEQKLKDVADALPADYQDFEEGMLADPANVKALHEVFKQEKWEGADLDERQFSDLLLGGIKKKARLPGGGTAPGETSPLGGLPAGPASPTPATPTTTNLPAGDEEFMPEGAPLAGGPDAVGVGQVPPVAEPVVTQDRAPAAEELAYLNALPGDARPELAVNGAGGKLFREYGDLPEVADGSTRVRYPADYAGAEVAGSYSIPASTEPSARYFDRLLSKRVAGEGEQGLLLAGARNMNNLIADGFKGLATAADDATRLISSATGASRGGAFADAAEVLEKTKKPVADYYKSHDFMAHPNAKNLLMATSDVAGMAIPLMAQALAPEAGLGQLAARVVGTGAGLMFDGQILQGAHDRAVAAGMSPDQAAAYTFLEGGLSIALFKGGGALLGKVAGQLTPDAVKSEILRETYRLLAGRGGKQLTRQELNGVLQQATAAATPRLLKIAAEGGKLGTLFGVNEAKNILTEAAARQTIGAKFTAPTLGEAVKRVVGASVEGAAIGGATGAAMSAPRRTLVLGQTPQGRPLSVELNAAGEPERFLDDQGPVDFGPQGPPPAVQAAVARAHENNPVPLPAGQMLSHQRVPVGAHDKAGPLFADYDTAGKPVKLYSEKGQVLTPALDDPQVRALVESKWPDAPKNNERKPKESPAAAQNAAPAPEMPIVTTQLDKSPSEKPKAQLLETGHEPDSIAEKESATGMVYDLTTSKTHPRTLDQITAFAKKVREGGATYEEVANFFHGTASNIIAEAKGDLKSGRLAEKLEAAVARKLVQQPDSRTREKVLREKEEATQRIAEAKAELVHPDFATRFENERDQFGEQTGRKIKVPLSAESTAKKRAYQEQHIAELEAEAQKLSEELNSLSSSPASSSAPAPLYAPVRENPRVAAPAETAAIPTRLASFAQNPLDDNQRIVASQFVQQLRDTTDPQSIAERDAVQRLLDQTEPAAQQAYQDYAANMLAGASTPENEPAESAPAPASGPASPAVPSPVNSENNAESAPEALPIPAVNATLDASSNGPATDRGAVSGRDTAPLPTAKPYATPAENRAAGAFEKDGQVYTRQAPLGEKVARGKQATAEFSAGVQQPVQYAVMEASDLQPSHLGGSQNLRHFLPEAQPKNRSAAYDPASQKAIADIAAAPDLGRLGEAPNAYSGAPIVNQRGEALQGNGRAAGVREHYRQGGALYKQDVVAAAEKAGIPASETARFTEPVLVRIADVSDQRARELGNYTAADTESGGKRRLDARQAAGRMDEEGRATLARLATPQGEATLTETIRGNAEALLRFLRKGGLVNETQLQTMVKPDGTLTPQGVEDIAALYRHQLFRDGDPNLPELFAELPAAAQGGLDRAVGSLLGVPEQASIVPDVQDALYGVREYLASGVDFHTWAGQADMFKGGLAPRERYSPLALKLVEKLATEKRPTYIARLFSQYAAAVKGEGASLFGETPPKTRAEAVAETFGVADGPAPAGNPRASEGAPRPGDADQRPPAPGLPPVPGPDGEGQALPPAAGGAAEPAGAVDDTRASGRRRPDKQLPLAAQPAAAITQLVQGRQQESGNWRENIAAVAEVSPQVRAFWQGQGVELAPDAVHTVDKSAINHALAQHGEGDSEALQGQLPVTEEDFARIPEIVAAPDRMEAGETPGRVVYVKRYNGTTYYVEEYQSGRHRLAAKTLYKRKTSSAIGSGIASDSTPSTRTSENDRTGTTGFTPEGTAKITDNQADGLPGDDTRQSGPKFFADLAEAPPVMAQAGRIAPDPIRGEKPKAQDQILLDLRKGSGVSIVFSKRPGGRKGSRALGSYNPRNAAVTVKAAADLDVTAHELGHALDDAHDLLPSASPTALAEIQPLARFGSQPPAGHSDPQLYRDGEALAEYVRAYLVNPVATKAAYPEFTRHYEATVPARMRAQVEAFGRDIRVFAGATAHEQVMSNVRMKPVEKTGILGILKPETVGNGGKFLLTFGDRVQATMLNALHPFEKAMRYAQEVTGQDELRPQDNPVTLARLFAGLNDKMDSQMRFGLVDSRNERRIDAQTGQVKNLTWLLDPLDKTTAGTIEAEQELVVSAKIARRTVELVERRVAEEIEAAHARGESVPDALLQQKPDWQQKYGADNARLKAQPGNTEAVIDEHQADTVSGVGAGVFTDLAVARQRLADHDALKASNPAQHARIEEAGRRYESWADDNLRYLLERGRIGQEQYDAIKENNAQYIALQRVMEAEPGKEINILSKGPGGKNFTAVSQPLQKIGGSGRTIKNPYSNLLDATYRVTREGDRNTIMQSFRELFTGSRVMYDGQAEDLAAVARPADAKDANVVTVYVKGQAEYWQLDADVFQAINELANTPLDGPLAKVLQSPAKLLRWTVTNSPVFAVRNLIRDTRSRLMVSTNRPERGFDLLINKQARLEARDGLDLAGGGQAGHYLSSETAYYDTMQQTMRGLAKDKRMLLADPGKWASGAWHGYTRLLGGSETIGRRMEYRAAYKEATRKGLDPYNASLHAALEARDLMDFAVAGTFMREVNKYVPFTNAAVQGLRRAARSIKENPGGFAARWTLYSLVPTLLVRGLIHKMGRDDEYAQLPAYQRDGFDNIPLPQGKWLVIPRPFELGTMAASADRFLSQQVADDPRAWAGYFTGSTDSNPLNGSLGKSFVPVDESALAGGLKPVLEVLTNHDFFKDKSIISPAEAKLDVDLRHTERGSRLGQWVGGAVGMDSRNVDHLVSGLGSYYGSWLLKASNFGREDGGQSFGLPDTGFLKEQPVTQARDVQWLQQRLEGAGLGQSKPARDLGKLLEFYYAQTTPEGKRRAGELATEYAQTLRGFLDEEVLKQAGHAKKAQREAKK